jgi:hypothetical protein
MSGVDFERKVAVQARDSFSSKDDLNEVDTFIRDQKVPGELIVSYPGNGGRSSVIFRSKEQVHNGQVLNGK